MTKLVVGTWMVGSLLVLSVGPAVAGTRDPGVKIRQAIQEERIDQGVASGELTPWEAGRLEAQQARIKQREQRMKEDGQLTVRERRRLHRQQNRASRNVYRKKHNGRAAD